MNYQVCSSYKVVSVLIALMFLTACEAPVVTPKPALLNVPQPPVEAGQGTVWIGPFMDERSHQDMGPNYIGTFRGAFGQVLARLSMDRPVSTVTAETMGNVFRSLGYRTSPMPSSLQVSYSNGWQIFGQSAEPRAPLLVGRVLSLYGKNSLDGLRREVGFTIEVCIIDLQAKKSVWCGQVKGNDGDKGYRAFDNHSEIVSAWIVRLLEDRAREVFSASSVRNIWKEQGGQDRPADAH